MRAQALTLVLSSVCLVFAALPARAFLTPADYGIVPLEPVFDRDVAVMGEPLKFRLRFKVVGARPPDRDYQIVVALADEYGHERASHVFSPSPPTSQWQPGAAVELPEESMRVPPQIEPDASQVVSTPPIYEGLHHFLLALRDPSSGDILDISGDSPGGPDPFPNRPTLRDFWVTGAPAVIGRLEPPGSQRTVRVTVESRTQETGDYRCRLLLKSPAGRVLWADSQPVTVTPPQIVSLAFSVPPEWCGKLVLRAELYQGTACLNWAQKPFGMTLPPDLKVAFKRANRVEGQGGARYLPVMMTLDAPPGTRARVEVLADGKPHWQSGPWAVGSQSLQQELRVPPHWGRFEFAVSTEGAQRCTYLWTCVATVVEVRDLRMFVNGEPFILKSVNVHGLHGGSRAITAQTMRILQGHGFNNMRADWPVLWQVRLAEELNLSYMPLGPYSCTDTEAVYKRYPLGDPLYGVRRETENFVRMFTEEAGVLLWNSANETSGDITRMLLAMYPVYKLEDPYQRPVVYANLGDQGEWQGMDIMGINVYAALGSRPRSTQSEIGQQIRLGAEHGRPVIFTEFNHWWGPVHWVGAEAVRDIGQFAIDHGMTGTTLYKSCDVPERHPGLIADPEAEGNLNQPMADALAEFNADVHVSLAGAAGAWQALICNKRPFTVEHPVLRLLAPENGEPVWTSEPVPDIPPKGTQLVSIMSIPEPFLGTIGAGLPLRVEYESHCGLRGYRQVTAFVEERE